MAWTSPDRPVGADWLAVLRGATQRQPKEAQWVAASLPEATGRFAEGAAAFLAGDMLSATRILRGVVAHPEAAPGLAAGARWRRWPDHFVVGHLRMKTRTDTGRGRGVWHSVVGPHGPGGPGVHFG